MIWLGVGYLLVLTVWPVWKNWRTDKRGSMLWLGAMLAWIVAAVFLNIDYDCTSLDCR